MAKIKTNRTQAPHVLTHRTTSWARRSLTSGIGRDWVQFAWYDRSWFGTKLLTIHIHVIHIWSSEYQICNINVMPFRQVGYGFLLLLRYYAAYTLYLIYFLKNVISTNKLKTYEFIFIQYIQSKHNKNQTKEESKYISVYTHNTWPYS